MWTVYNRGTKDNPNLYVGYPQAKRYVQEIESRLARGQVGIEAHTDTPTFQVLFDAFLEGLTNRNAKDDRSRGRRHLLPPFGKKQVASVNLASIMEWIHGVDRRAARRGRAERRLDPPQHEPSFVGAHQVTLKKKGTKVATELRPTMTWYQATRHSFASRYFSAGGSLDEVSAAVGHSSPVVTKRFYDHYVRRSFSPTLRAGLGAQQAGTVVPMNKGAR